jgi:hypothetical protein
MSIDHVSFPVVMVKGSRVNKVNRDRRHTEQA